MIKVTDLRYAGLTGILTAVIVLAGCSVLPKAEPQTVYALPDTQITERVQTTQSVQPWALRVQTPYSHRMLNSNRIVVRPDNSEVSVYKGVRWSDPAPVLLRDHLVNAFRTQAAVASVTSDSTHLTADLELGGDLTRFQVEYQDGTPVVHIQLDAFLVDPSNSHIVANQRFFVTEPVKGKEVPEVVLAFGEATDRLAVDIVAWVLKHSPNGVKGRQG